MTFYNPFFPQYPRNPFIQSTKSTQNVNKPLQTSNSNNKSNCTSKPSPPTPHKNIPQIQGILQNYLKETDTLIILGLLFFLYTQENKDFSLMLCLFLLLFEN